jgi:hypothetical protein
MDNVVLNWISNFISTDLHQVVRQHGCTACHLWLAIENQFLGNREHHAFHLDTVFHTFVQGDLSINEYCHKFKDMADDLADLDAPVDDRILILNIIRWLNQRFEHVGFIIRRYSSFLNFLKVQDDLLLKELHIDSTEPPINSTTLKTNITSLVTKPWSSTCLTRCMAHYGQLRTLTAAGQWFTARQEERPTSNGFVKANGTCYVNTKPAIDHPMGCFRLEAHR